MPRRHKTVSTLVHRKPLLTIRTVRKRSGEREEFDQRRIEAAIRRAACEVGRDDPDLPSTVAALVVERLATGRHRIPGVEQIQNEVERALLDRDLAEVARAYVLYRERRAELRESKHALGVRDELKLSLGAVVVLKERYLRRDEAGNAVESTGQMMDRVANFVAQGEERYQDGSSTHWGEKFAGALRGLWFLPNSPTLMNAGTKLGLLSACFVLPIEDSLASIFETLRTTALVQAGGGTGFSFSRLRPAGDRVTTTGGVASS